MILPERLAAGGKGEAGRQARNKTSRIQPGHLLAGETSGAIKCARNIQMPASTIWTFLMLKGHCTGEYSSACLINTSFTPKPHYRNTSVICENGSLFFNGGRVEKKLVSFYHLLHSLCGTAPLRDHVISRQSVSGTCHTILTDAILI